MSFAPDAAADARLTATLRLSLVPGVGPKLYRSLIERFETPEAVLSAAASELRHVDGVGEKLARNIVTASGEIDAETELRLCRENRIEIIRLQDENYPRPLREIHDPPPILFVRGELRPQDALAVAVVGSRHATRYGVDQAERLAGGLGRAGFTVVSGMARGIDAAAHRGALAAAGRTLAVLGSGLLEIYPPEHKELADQIASQGAILSEFPPRMAPMGGMFPQRNRVITGLSLGVIVVEATETSGALISARHAMEQGREVFAVPGRADSRSSRGCHRLIRDGAKLVETVDDVLEELGPLAAPALRPDGTTVHHPAELDLNDVEQQVLQAIDPDPTAIDTVIARTGLAVHSVLATISVLEMRRVIRKVSGNLVMRI
jgi:DNA processing protein